MDYVNVGSSGLRVSRVCLGMMTYGAHESRAWGLDEAAAEPLVRRAVEGGITFFDTADTYNGGESEVATGRLLRRLLGMREEYVVATKVYFPTMPGENGRGLSRKHILASIDASLGRLGLDYVDLYQIHRWDYETPIEETLEALHDMVKAGKVRYIGGSSMYSWQFAKSLYISQMRGWARFVSMQNHYNLLYREEEREMMGLCRSENIAVLPWSPLARGRLTRPWKSDTTKRAETDVFGNAMYAHTEAADEQVVNALGQVAEQRGISRAQVAMAWLLSRPGVTSPIVGATKKHHLEDAAAALNVHLTKEETSTLEAPYIPHPVLGFN